MNIEIMCQNVFPPYSHLLFSSYFTSFCLTNTFSISTDHLPHYNTGATAHPRPITNPDWSNDNLWQYLFYFMMSESIKQPMMKRFLSAMSNYRNGPFDGLQTGYDNYNTILLLRL